MKAAANDSKYDLTSREWFLSGRKQIREYLTGIEDSYSIRWPVRPSDSNIIDWLEMGWAIPGGAVVKLQHKKSTKNRVIISVEQLNRFTRDAWRITLPAFRRRPDEKVSRVLEPMPSPDLATT